MSLHNKIVADEQGRITIGDFYNEDKNYSQSYGTQDHVKVLGVNLKQTLGQTEQTYASAFNVSTTLTNELDNNSDLRPRATIFNSGMDMAGQSYTRPGLKRGPMATAHGVSVQNTSDSAVTLQTMSAQLVETMINQSAGQDGDITVIDAIGIKSATHIDNQGSGNSKFHNHFSFYSENNHEQVDKGYGFYVADQKAKEGYAFYDNSNSVSKFGPVVIWNETKVDMEKMIRKLESITCLLYTSPSPRDS